MKNDNIHRIQFLGCPIDSITMNQTVEQCLQWCREPRRSHLLVTVNVAILIMMRKDKLLREACVTADLVTADGVPVVWSSRLLGTPLVERVSGVDLLPRLLKMGSENHLRVYFLGARQEIVEKMVALCHESYQDIVIAGYHHGYFAEEDHPRIISEIYNSNADFLFIGMPTPFKETWCYQHKDELNVPVIIGVGGSFDVLTGYIPRAPKWMQNIGMEWFWRFMMEPRKMWKRYLVTNTIFISLMIHLIIKRALSRS